MTPNRLAEIQNTWAMPFMVSSAQAHKLGHELIAGVKDLQAKIKAANIEGLIWRMAAWRRARQRPAPVMSQAIKVETIPCPLCEGAAARVVAICPKCSGTQTLQRLVELGYGI